MSKSKFIKILVATLTLCLILGAAIGVSAFAAEEDATEEYAIKYVSKNVEYGSKTYLYYAVAEDYIPEADRAEGKVWMNVYNADGSFAFKQFPEAELLYIDVLEANCYIFKTRGVPAKELNTIEMVQVVTESGAKSALESYSVEEYLYQRLYGKEGFALKTEADGKDYARRSLYFDLLKYGAIAQKVLAPEAEDKIADATFVIAPAAKASLGRFDEPTKVVITHDDAKTPLGKQFLGWKYAMHDAFGRVIKEGYAADGAAILAEGFVSFDPVYDATVNHNYITFDDGDAGTVSSTPEAILAKVGGGTAGIVDGKWSVTKSMNINELKAAVTAWNADPANASNPLTAPGSTNITTFAAVNTRVDGANVVEFVADFSYANNGGSTLEYINIYSGRNANNLGDNIYYAYVNISGGYLCINTEYGASSNSVVNVKTPIKADGTVCKLTIRFIYDPSGSRLEFYADGQLFHTTTTFKYASNPTVDKIGCVRFNMSNSPKGTLTLDNVAMTQAYSEYYDIDFEDLSSKGVVNDFDGAGGTVTEATDPTETKYYTYESDPVTGNNYLVMNKWAENGMSIDVNVSKKEENANIAIFAFDIFIEEVGPYTGTSVSFANQIYFGHSKYNAGYLKNEATPTMASMPLKPTVGKWMHVEITYRVAEVDAEGNIVKIEQAITIDGEHPENGISFDEKTGVYKNGNSYFDVFGNPGNFSGGGIEIPGPEDIMVARFSLNNYARAKVLLDNISLQILCVEGCDPKVV